LSQARSIKGRLSILATRLQGFKEKITLARELLNRRQEFDLKASLTNEKISARPK